MSKPTPIITVREIERAMEKNELVLFYQPKVSMITGRICGAEALLRWKRADGSMVPPYLFIPLAEESGLIKKITVHVFQLLSNDMPAIMESDRELVVSFNASGKDFDDDVFTEIIINTLDNEIIRAENLEVEVTETVLLNESVAKACLTKLSERGVSIAMDDFGTGHSGITTLSKWPFDTIKIDKSLVDGVMESNKKHFLMQATIRMAHQLNLNIVAEGVEDMISYQMLQNYGCRVVQGFLVGKPMELRQFIHYRSTYENYPAKPVGLLYMAQLDHIQWRKGIIDSAIYLHCSTEDNKFDNVRSCPELNHEKCKLGQWYYSQDNQIEDNELFQSVELPHKELHDLGVKLLNRASDNCDWDEFNELAFAISQKSLQLLEILQNLENKISTNDLSGGQGLW